MHAYIFILFIYVANGHRFLKGKENGNTWVKVSIIDVLLIHVYALAKIRQVR